jgi:hypothetical protein
MKIEVIGPRTGKYTGDLLSAAPDLLALLREVHDAVANGTADFSPSGDWFREASRVIAKATGEAP